MRLLLRVTAASLLSAVAIPAFASFSDVTPWHPSVTAIEYLQEKGVVGGYSDGTFRPEQSVNRAEFVKILIGAKYEKLQIDTCLEDVEDSYHVFPDVPVGIWYENYVCIAKNLKIVGGYPDGTFGGDREISFAEAAKIIALTFDLLETSTSVWYEGYVRALATKNAIPMTIMRFDQQITRGEMAEMIWRLDARVTYETSQSFESLSTSVSTNTSPIKILTMQLPPEEPFYAEIDPETIERGVNGVDCQPALFDPDKSKLYKDDEGNNRFWPDVGADVFINGGDSGQSPTRYLLPPFNLTYYKVECASELNSYILEIKKDGKRHGLYTHVLTWTISPNQKYLFLKNFVPVKDGKWQQMSRIIEIASKRALHMPDTDCNEDWWAKWQGNLLLTHSAYDYYSDGDAYQQSTTICIWNNKAEVVARLEAVLEWNAGGAFEAVDDIGLLPNDSNTFFVFHVDLDKQQLILQFQDLKNQDRYRLITISYPTPTDPNVPDPYVSNGPTIELDATTSFDSKTIRYRFNDTYRGLISPWHTYP